MDERKYDSLRLENQLCFPLYAASKEIIRRYKPLLDPMDLTYTQYIALLALWEKGAMTVKALGEMLYLDSGTLTPVLKKLESKGYIDRARSVKDERSVVITLTEAGLGLREQALSVPVQIAECVGFSPEETALMRSLLVRLMDSPDRN